MKVLKKRIEKLKYDEWEPIYKDIINDFDYPKEADRKSAEILSKIRGSDDLKPLKKIAGKVVEIIGPFAEEIDDHYIIAAGSSVTRLQSMERKPDLMISDLDGDTKLQLKYNLSGVPIVIHAHGDNVQKIKDWGPKFKGHVIASCQCRPPKGVYNFGGFTDGDRGVFIADHFNAKKILLNGWDFEEPYSKNVDMKIKKRKLKWAKKLIKQIKTPVLDY